MITANDLTAIVDRLETADVTVWLDGGWGVDVLSASKRARIRISTSPWIASLIEVSRKPASVLSKVAVASDRKTTR